MSLVVLGSAHASPGVTTTAVTLAAVWPQRRRCLLVEADPFGGVIAARYGLGDTPGLSSLAAAARTGVDDETVWRHVQELRGGVPVLVGPVSSEESHVVLRDVASGLAGWCAGQGEVDLIADCGRIALGSPTGALLAAADSVLVLTRPSVDQLRPAAHRLAAFEASGTDAELLLVGDTPYGRDEVAETLEIKVAGVVAWDPKTAAVITGSRGTVRDLRRSRLVRSVATLAERLTSGSGEADPVDTAVVPQVVDSDISEGDADMSVDSDLGSRLHHSVAEKLSEQLGSLDGDQPLSLDDERALTRSLIASELAVLAEDAYRQGRSPLDSVTESELADAVFDRVHGLGRLQRYVDDPDLANIHVNGCDNVWLVYRDGTKLRGEAAADSDRELIDIVATAARRVGRSEKRWDQASWELHLQLPGGERLHAVMGLTGRPAVTIRRHDFTIHRVKHLIDLGVVDEGLAAFLTAAVRARLNLVVAGGTNTGKTTMLRCLLNEVPPEERVVTVEDNLEIGLDRFSDLHPDQVMWERRGANIEGHGEATLADCVKATLRQNPDRVIVGEIRGVEVVDMLRAMSQGNDGSMSSIHADSSKGAVVRLGMYTAEAGLEEETSNKWIANAVDLIIHLGWVNGMRRVTSIREIVDAEARQIATNEIYRPDTDGRAVPAGGPTIRHDTLARLVDAGFDQTYLANPKGWW